MSLSIVCLFVCLVVRDPFKKMFIVFLKISPMKASIITVITCTTVITGLTIDRSQPTNRRKSRIAYGERFDQECFPYVVGLKIALSNSHTNYCTGTLMSPLFVLTAAHCIVDSTSIEVIFIIRTLHLD